ncbi:MAG TPA: glutamate racemase [Rhodospirillaceae bacterium]|nr:glutamate racemase [Rhodospirillaceae bacterium]
MILIDSGVGGLTVARAIRATMPVQMLYVADNAGFPYGALTDVDLVARIERLVVRALDLVDADGLVVACNTASTVVLDALRARHAIPIIGVVPAVKWAASISESRRIGVLATAATVARPYLAELIKRFAGDCEVFVHGAAGLADLAERAFRGELVADSALIDEIAPLFAPVGADAIDTVALGCTHYPLLQARIEAAFPGVRFLDPAGAVARQVARVVSPGGAWRGSVAPDTVLFTAQPEHRGALQAALRAEAFPRLAVSPI